ncbi:hypothetical protein [Paraglaciecola aestuariivivens]
MSLFALLLSQTLIFAPQPDIRLEVTQSEPSSHWAFLAPHQTEHIANDYVASQIQQKGGIFVVLKQNGKRHIYLTIQQNSYQVDPNRIFTPLGRKQSLLRLNPQLANQPKDLQLALKRSADLAEFILQTMQADKVKTWVAIHNNTNGYTGDGHGGRGNVSIKRYAKKLLSGANYLIQVNDAEQDEDDLFFITHSQDFEAMRQAGYNVVRQNPKVATDPSEDDGSLSVLAEKRGYRYINIEAERSDHDGFGENHLNQQKHMIDLVFELLTQQTKSTQ